jgi:hypothetical protein
MSLYKIQETYLSIMREAEENEGVISEESNELLVITQEKFKEQAEELAKVIKTLEAEVSFAEAEIERIKTFILYKNNFIDRLKSNLVEALKMFGEKDPKKDIWRYTAGTFKLGTRQSESVKIDDDFIDNKYKVEIIKTKLPYGTAAKIIDTLNIQVEVTHEVPKTEIKDKLKAGEKIEGAELVSKHSLNLK